MRLVISLCFILIECTVAFGQAKIDGIAAVVDNKVILYSEVFSMAEQEAAALKLDKSSSPEKYFEIVEKLLDLLIDNKLQVAEAEKDSLVVILVLDEDVQEQVNSQIQGEVRARGSERAVEEFWSITMPELRELLTKQTKEQFLIQQLVRRRTADVTISRSELEKFYEMYKDSIPPYPAVYDMSHILNAPLNSGDVIEAKRVFMDSLRQIILGGEDFADMAGNFSDDPGSASNGGDLGWQTPGTFVEKFDSTIATLQPGEISEIVKTQFGFHIIQLLERNGSRFRSRHILSLLIPTEDDIRRTIDDLKNYRESSLNGEDFGELAVKFSIDPEAKESKGRMGEWEVDRIKSVLPQFYEVVKNLKDGDISEPFKSEFGYHILKLNKFSGERMRNVVDDYDYIFGIALDNKRNNYYSQWFADAKKRAYIEIKINEDSLSTDQENSLNK